MAPRCPNSTGLQGVLLGIQPAESMQVHGIQISRERRQELCMWRAEYNYRYAGNGVTQVTGLHRQRDYAVTYVSGHFVHSTQSNGNRTEHAAYVGTFHEGLHQVLPPALMSSMRGLRFAVSTARRLVTVVYPLAAKCLGKVQRMFKFNQLNCSSSCKSPCGLVRLGLRFVCITVKVKGRSCSLIWTSRSDTWSQLR